MNDPVTRRMRYVLELHSDLQAAEDSDDLVGVAERAIEQLSIAYGLVSKYEGMLLKAGLVELSSGSKQ
jgi:hypothetical protein